jgi:hypothetical protein
MIKEKDKEFALKNGGKKRPPTDVSELRQLKENRLVIEALVIYLVEHLKAAISDIYEHKRELEERNHRNVIDSE